MFPRIAGAAGAEPTTSAADSPRTGNVRRIALVIGNGAYNQSAALKESANDARDMAATLRALGFDVTSGINANQRDMKRLIREFGQKLKAGGSDCSTTRATVCNQRAQTTSFG